MNAKITFNTDLELKQHKQTDHPKQEVKCKLCKGIYASKKSLDTHIKIKHEGKKEFMCSECGQTFGKGTHLNIHMRMHSGEKSYACFVCDKKYATKYESHLHLMNHHNILPQACTKCDARFKLQRELIAHMQEKHPLT